MNGLEAAGSKRFPRKRKAGSAMRFGKVLRESEEDRPMHVVHPNAGDDTGELELEDRKDRENPL